MAYFLFVDESGQDHKESPYEVLSGLAVRDRDLGRVTHEARENEFARFGCRYSHGDRELKGKHLLKRKVFQHARLNVPVHESETKELALAALTDGAGADLRQLKSLAMAKLSFVSDMFTLCHKCGCKAFASITEVDAPKTSTKGLWKDYAYLFERFFYFLERHGGEQGIIVFDELEKSKSHILIDQMYQYFRTTQVGQQRSSLIVPEPFFVHSELTTGVQLADLAAYVISWGFRLPRMRKPARLELEEYGRQVAGLRHYASRTSSGRTFTVGSFAHITYLRTNLERLAESSIEEGEG